VAIAAVGAVFHKRIGVVAWMSLAAVAGALITQLH
jgi:hypothetical protein